MFKVVTRPKFRHSVPIMVPIDGGHAEQTMAVTYQVARDQDETQLNTSEGMIEFLKDVVISVSDIVNEEDEPVPYNDALRDQLLSLPYVRVGWLRGYLAAVTKGRLGN